jgi:hypothetical protein
MWSSSLEKNDTLLGNDKKTRLTLRWNMAEPVVADTKTSVNAAIAPAEAKETTSNTVELDTENYGAPPENSGIATYKKRKQSLSFTEPQAWEDEYGNWFYNFAGAMKLAWLLGRTLPNIDQLIAAINVNPDNFRQSVVYRVEVEGEFYELDRFSFFWSSSENGSIRAYFARLQQGVSSAGRNWCTRRHGLSVRFIVDKR